MHSCILTLITFHPLNRGGWTFENHLIYKFCLSSTPLLAGDDRKWAVRKDAEKIPMR